MRSPRRRLAGGPPRAVARELPLRARQARLQLAHAAPQLVRLLVVPGRAVTDMSGRVASDRARRVYRESPTRVATRSANAELAALTYENERLRRRCADAEAMSARLRSAAALAAAASPA